MSADRSSRPPRRPSGAGRPRPGGGRPGAAGGGKYHGSSRSGTGSRSGPPRSGASRSGAPRRGAPRRPERPPTAAERRAAEVNARRAPRPERTAADEQAKIEGRALEEWIDEGELRAQAEQATSRAQVRPAPARPPRQRDLEPEDAADIGAKARDPRRAAQLRDRLAHAQDALDRERFDEARRIGTGLAKEVPGVAAVHELLGLVAYRTGRWKQGVSELELAQTLRSNVVLLPVLADCYRALRRYDEVERVWADVRSQSPGAEVMAEGRIVAAGAEADQGDLPAALRTMSKASVVPKRVRDHNLRQWYVLADLHDRAGDTLEAARWFRLIAEHDRDFVDVTDRLRALGR